MHPRAPLYAALSAGIARDPELSGLLFHAPRTQRIPVLLFACTHYLLLDEGRLLDAGELLDDAKPRHRLAEWYPSIVDDPRAPDDPELLPAFKDFVGDRAPQLFDLLETRSTQTNEVARCLLLLPALGLVADEVGPLAHLDVGCSAGLTLLTDRYRYHYIPEEGGPGTTLGPDSTVELTASVRGDLVLPARLPSISARRGLDLAPVDVHDGSQARWLEACVWPDQPDRFQRLRAALAIAQQDPPELDEGDAVLDLAPTIDGLTGSGHPVITNSWVLNYLTPEQRSAYVTELDRIGQSIDLSWSYAESPSMTPELPWALDPVDEHLTVTTLVRWRNGHRTVEHLMTSHPHGYWIHAH